MFKPPYSLGLQVAPTAVAICSQGSQAVYPTHNSVGSLPRDVVLLHVRIGQLTWRDFHSLDCDLVGCSPSPLPCPLHGRLFLWQRGFFGWHPTLTLRMLLSCRKITLDLIALLRSWRHSGFKVFMGAGTQARGKIWPDTSSEPPSLRKEHPTCILRRRWSIRQGMGSL